MAQSQIPVIFIHYGNSKYLRTTLNFAQRFNPDKGIFLLGDSSNQHYQAQGIKHVLFAKYDQESKLQIFNQVFQYIRGGKTYTEFPGKMKMVREFERFCFARWFYLYYFMQENQLERCWYFDSDTLLLTKLSEQESKYQNYDCTEQCNGFCMKGLISQTALHDYITEINSLFQDENYLEKIKIELTAHPNWAFCDMRAYDAYKQKYKIRTIPLFQIINQQVFDDALAQERNSEMETNKLLGKKIKKLYFANQKIYIKNPQDGMLVQLNCVNLSWLPNFFINKISTYLTTGEILPDWRFFIPALTYRLKNKLKQLLKQKHE